MFDLLSFLNHQKRKVEKKYFYIFEFNRRFLSRKAAPVTHIVCKTFTKRHSAGRYATAEDFIDYK